MSASLSFLVVALLASAPPTRANDAPGQKIVDAFAASLGKGLRACEDGLCLAEAESRCQRARFAYSEIPGERTPVFIDQFVVPEKGGCRVVTFRDYGAFDGGWMEKASCRTGDRESCETTISETEAKTGEPRRIFSDVEFERLRGHAFAPSTLDVKGLLEVQISGIPKREERLVIAVSPWGREALLRPGDRVGKEGLRFVEWHPVPAGWCADFRTEKGELEQLCESGVMGDFGEP